MQIAEEENLEVDAKFRVLVAIGSLVCFEYLYVMEFREHICARIIDMSVSYSSLGYYLESMMILLFCLKQMLEGLVKKIAIDFDVENIAKISKASKETKIAEVGVDIELLTRQS